MVIPFKIKLGDKLTDDEKGNFRIIKQGHRESFIYVWWIRKENRRIFYYGQLYRLWELRVGMSAELHKAGRSSVSD